jgi:hypothetical protein
MNEDRDLDELFAGAGARTQAPHGFADRVLARVALEREAPARVAVPVVGPESAWAFWLRAASHPAVALAFALAGIVAAWPVAVAGGGVELASSLGGAVTHAWFAFLGAAYGALPALRDPWSAGVLVALAAVPLAWLAAACARLAERWTRRLAWPTA